MTRVKEIEEAMPYKEALDLDCHDDDKIQANWYFASGAIWSDKHLNREKLFNTLQKMLPTFDEVLICTFVELILKHWNNEEKDSK